MRSSSVKPGSQNRRGFGCAHSLRKTASRPLRRRKVILLHRHALVHRLGYDFDVTSGRPDLWPASPMTTDIETRLQRAVALHSQGAVADAARAYAEILTARPEHADALHLLGVAETQLGRAQNGLDLISKSLAINPSQPVAVANSGNALIALRKPAEALARYERALTMYPDYALAHNGRGNALLALGRPEEALVSFEHALRLAPDFVEALNGCGNALLRLNRIDHAIANYDRAILLDPKHSQALVNRGIAYLELQSYDQALRDQDRAIEISPRFAEAHCGRGHSLLGQVRPRDALVSFERALQIEPDNAEALLGRGHALSELRQTGAAVAAYDEALRLNPGVSTALFERGTASLAAARPEDAVAFFRRLRQIEPHNAQALGACLHAQLQLCDWRDYSPAVTEIVAEVDAGRAVEFLGSFAAVCDSPGRQLLWARQLADKYRRPQPPLWTGQHYAHERIRVAYVSADFLEHPTAYLMAGLFEKHDRRRFETIAIALRDGEESPTAQRLRAAFDHFILTGAQSDAAIARQIRNLEVDIAVDLMGYTAGHRTLIFTHRPAPVQVNYLGYPATMGAADMDYIIADDFLIPQKHLTDYREQVVYLPDCYQANDDKRPRPVDLPTRSAMGLPASCFVWSAFHSSYKINPLVFDIWARLLCAVPDSVLWLVGGNRAVEQNLRHEANARHVDPRRLIFAERLPYAQHLARLALTDLCLDTLPYNGGATSSDALWVGVPVITCTGQSYAARMTGSLLHALHMPELITETLEQYEELALQLARSPRRLATLRATLADNATTSPLFQTDRFRRHLEEAYIAMVERCHRNERAASLRIEALAP
jgi:protein O-GlcNAc transferase